MTTIWGVLVVAVAGLLMGGAAWPLKQMKTFHYEHWAFVAMLVGLVIIPWSVTLILCPNAIEAYKTVDTMVLVKSNLFSLSWGLANVLGLLCMVRIGFSLTTGILVGLGVSIGVIVPLIFKGSGLFKNAADVTSPAGKLIICGVIVMLLGVVLTSLAGFERHKVLEKHKRESGNFLVSLIMVIVAGIASCGISFSFVYSQGPIKEAMKVEGAGDIPSIFAVWAIGLVGGALVNILYPTYLITKNKSWNVLRANIRELVLAVIIGINLCVSIACMGKGMMLLGSLGASVGFGIQQAMQIVGGQGVGFISGEWNGVTGKPRHLIYTAIAVLFIAAMIMSYGNFSD